MSRLKKALERCEAIRDGRDDGTVLSEREQLERDIGEVLKKEFPEMLGNKQKRIRLSYSRTKTVPVNSEKLEQNRVYAHLPDMKITEQIEMLRYQVIKSLRELNANTLMITSANHNEGKTFISANLAVSIAKNRDRTVMLVDADFNKRSYGSNRISSVFFGSDCTAGLSEYLQGTTELSEILINPGISRLTVLPRGSDLANSASFLGSVRMEGLIDELKSRYANERITLFDCPAFLSNADPLILSKFIDAVLLVVEPEKTQESALKRVMDMLKDKPIIGTVMNKAR